MTGIFRQKLLNWFCTIGIVLLGPALPMVHYWLVELPEYLQIRDVAFPVVDDVAFPVADIAGNVAELVILYAILAPLALWWHLFDFIERERSATSRFSNASDHRVFLWTITAAVGLLVLIGTRTFEYNSCDQLDGALHFQCLVGPSRWIFYPWVASMMLAVVLCLIKTGHSIRSQFEKSQ